MSAGLSAWQHAEIRARLERARTTAGCGRWADGEYEVIVAALADVPALLAEVGRLAERVADLEVERLKLVRWHEEDARQMKVWGRRVARAQRDVAAARVAGLLEAAEIVGNDDDCTCGGCDTCEPRRLAALVRDRAASLTTEGGESR